MSRIDTDYPVGRKEWRVLNDACQVGNDVIRNLTLTSCEFREFTCDSGDCIDIDKVNTMKVSTFLLRT